MPFSFTKMHGLGNDFVVIDTISQTVSLTPDAITKLADRHLGVGFDQLLLVESSDDEWADFRYRIFNADGSEVEQCGNGARCFARFVYDQGLTQKTAIPVITSSGRIVLHLQDNGDVLVDMGLPIFEPQRIPFAHTTQQLTYTLVLDEQSPLNDNDTTAALTLAEADVKEGRINVTLSAVSMGNPHAVLLVNDIDSAPVDLVGSIIERHNNFPERVNVGFMQVIDRSHIKLRVFERGVGETQACGTGACAAAVSGIRRGLLDNDVQVDLLGGRLAISWQNTINEQQVMMTGPAETVFTGQITL